MRIVGYVRETPGPQEGETAYAQSEKIRRWVVETGHQLVAVCQDTRQAGHALGREGYQALLGIIGSGQVDAVLVSSVATFSLDKIVQEIMIWDLRGRGVAILSTEGDDLEDLKDPPEDLARLLVRDVLARVGEHLHHTRDPSRATMLPVDAPPEDVVIELIQSADDGPSGIRRID